ncbi:MAG: hypothetical protein EDQ89_10165, partial [Acidobacteria bacterium]
VPDPLDPPPALFDLPDEVFPGVLIGGRLAFKSGKNLLRSLLSVVLIASGITLITKGDGAVVMVTAAFVSLMFGVVFTYVLRREVKLPHGVGIRAWKLVSVPWRRPTHLIEVDRSADGATPPAADRASPRADRDGSEARDDPALR